MVSAKLLMPAGAPVQDSSGDTLSPTQFGFWAFLLATFFGIMVPSLKVVEVRVKAACAFAVSLTHQDARIMPPAAMRLHEHELSFRSYSPLGSQSPQPVAGTDDRTRR